MIYRFVRVTITSYINLFHDVMTTSAGQDYERGTHLGFEFFCGSIHFEQRHVETTELSVAFRLLEEDCATARVRRQGLRRGAATAFTSYSIIE